MRSELLEVGRKFFDMLKEMEKKGEKERKGSGRKNQVPAPYQNRFDSPGLLGGMQG